MPDFTIEYFYFCASYDNFRMDIKGSLGRIYTVSHGPSPFGDPYWHCTCPGFKFHHKCKHIEEAKPFYCGWDQFVDEGTPHISLDEDGKTPIKVCPRCGDRLLVRKVAV